MGSSVVLYLSSSGNTFTHYEGADTHPCVKKASECKTHQAVLEFVQGLKGDENCQLYHDHNPKYRAHSSIKGRVHQCPREKMISFVELRIKEKNSPHGTFDKIGTALGRTFHYLTMASVVPVVGIIPGAIRMGIGAVQTVGGIALATIFAIPAYGFESEYAQIIVKRSLKHVAWGPTNIIIGAAQGTPLLGTWLYIETHSKP